MQLQAMLKMMPSEFKRFTCGDDLLDTPHRLLTQTTGSSTRALNGLAGLPSIIMRT